jgi:phosphoserine phosphatase RsbU/P
MPLPQQLKSIYQRLGWVDRIFILVLALYAILLALAPASGWTALALFVVFVLGIWLVIRLIRMGARRVIWRLRNRLIVTYLFIALVPVLLVIALAGFSLWGMASQVAVYLVTSELDRRVSALQAASDSILRTSTDSRADVMRHLAELLYEERFPGMEMMLRTGNSIERYPRNGSFPPPPKGWGNTSGVLRKDGEFYAWSHVQLVNGDFTVVAPLSREYLSNLVPNLGVVQFLLLRPSKKGTIRVGNDRKLEVQRETDPTRGRALPPPVNRFDIEVRWSSLVQVANWDQPGGQTEALIYVRSRPSAVYNALFTRKEDTIQDFIPLALLVISIAFLIVELVSLIIGITMTRTITGAVHHLYQGTQRVMQGDFSHRIEVRGNDQLADLSHSFNQMTARLEELVVVAKEKERLQSELEIAREVQNQLYPKKVPEVRTLRLTAVCKPARMVSGDYFDYECVRGQQLSLAIGDVAGKGISAALLMATVQSSLRTELRASLELATAAPGARGHSGMYSTALLVTHINEQLYAYTSPEKYATFYLGIYDEDTSVLTYTNAGHLPPILIRDGEAARLNVDGTVVGAFPFAQFEESRLELKPDDLLVCFTDGVSEPENEYGEMFGEDRLIQLLTRNVHRSEDQIVASIIEAVEQWTGTAELQDDMTLLLARRK